MDVGSIVLTLLTIPAVLVALTFHEYSHGYAAFRLGDPTPHALGRLTLNPFRHLDLLGTLSMIFLKFGWAKPVPINTRYFKKPRRDMAIVALCGPLANFLLSLLGALLFVLSEKGCVYLFTHFAIPTLAARFLTYTLQFLYIFHYVNLTLGLFNCIPIPPLDGSRVLMLFLPPRAALFFIRYERYFSLALVLLLLLGAVSGALATVAAFLSDAMLTLFTVIFGS